MKSFIHGNHTSEVEILNVSQHGIWIWIHGKEYFMDYDIFPWFKKAKLEQVFDVTLLNQTHLFWKSLDIDLELESIQNPEKYPLSSKA